MIGCLTLVMEHYLTTACLFGSNLSPWKGSGGSCSLNQLTASEKSKAKICYSNFLFDCFSWLLPSTGNPALNQLARCRLSPLRLWQNQPIPYRFSGRGEFSPTVLGYFRLKVMVMNWAETIRQLTVFALTSV